ncbi:MAG: large-conductance mechanosensitive channel protein MscL [Blastocatellia bacterium]
MGMVSEFKEFINKGNVMDLAVGVIIGGAFGRIVSSMVDDLISPILGLIMGGTNLADLALKIGEHTVTKEGKAEVVPLLFKYGSFIQNIINFLLIALVIFWLVKVYNRIQKTAPPAPTPSETLLGEIRDLLKKR